MRRIASKSGVHCIGFDMPETRVSADEDVNVARRCRFHLLHLSRVNRHGLVT